MYTDLQYVNTLSWTTLYNVYNSKKKVNKVKPCTKTEGTKTSKQYRKSSILKCLFKWFRAWNKKKDFHYSSSQNPQIFFLNSRTNKHLIILFSFVVYSENVGSNFGCNKLLQPPTFYAPDPPRPYKVNCLISIHGWIAIDDI